MNPTKEALGVRNYLAYIENRMRYVKLLSNGIECNEYRYYHSMLNRIKKWSKNHAVFFAHTCGKVSTEEGKMLLGVPERTFYRLMRKQRKELISLIKQQEAVLSQEYPFIPVTDIFEQLVVEA